MYRTFEVAVNMTSDNLYSRASCSVVFLGSKHEKDSIVKLDNLAPMSLVVFAIWL